MQEDVGRVEVAVTDALLVHVLHARGDGFNAEHGGAPVVPHCRLRKRT